MAFFFDVCLSLPPQSSLLPVCGFMKNAAAAAAAATEAAVHQRQQQHQ